MADVSPPLPCSPPDERAEPITIACTLGPRDTREWTMAAPVGARVSDLLAEVSACLGVDVEARLACGEWRVGVWGETCTPQRALQAGDRLEFYGGLRVDPKVARRERFCQQGARTTGLFAKRRAGSKPGY